MKAIRVNDNSNPTIEVHNHGSLGKTLIAGGVGAVAGGAVVFGALKGPELVKKIKEKSAKKANGKEKPATPADSGASGQSSGSTPSESSKPVSPETNS